jgi:hypothetical protein
MSYTVVSHFTSSEARNPSPSRAGANSPGPQSDVDGTLLKCKRAYDAAPLNEASAKSVSYAMPTVLGVQEDDVPTNTTRFINAHDPGLFFHEVSPSAIDVMHRSTSIRLPMYRVTGKAAEYTAYTIPVSGSRPFQYGNFVLWCRLGFYPDGEETVSLFGGDSQYALPREDAVVRFTNAGTVNVGCEVKRHTLPDQHFSPDYKYKPMLYHYDEVLGSKTWSWIIVFHRAVEKLCAHTPFSNFRTAHDVPQPYGPWPVCIDGSPAIPMENVLSLYFMDMFNMTPIPLATPNETLTLHNQMDCNHPTPQLLGEILHMQTYTTHARSRTHLNGETAAYIVVYQLLQQSTSALAITWEDDGNTFSLTDGLHYAVFVRQPRNILVVTAFKRTSTNALDIRRKAYQYDSSFPEDCKRNDVIINFVTGKAATVKPAYKMMHTPVKRQGLCRGADGKVSMLFGTFGISQSNEIPAGTRYCKDVAGRKEIHFLSTTSFVQRHHGHVLRIQLPWIMTMSDADQMLLPPNDGLWYSIPKYCVGLQELVRRRSGLHDTRSLVVRHAVTGIEFVDTKRPSLGLSLIRWRSIRPSTFHMTDDRGNQVKKCDVAKADAVWRCLHGTTDSGLSKSGVTQDMLVRTSIHQYLDACNSHGLCGRSLGRPKTAYPSCWGATYPMLIIEAKGSVEIPTTTDCRATHFRVPFNGVGRLNIPTQPKGNVKDEPGSRKPNRRRKVHKPKGNAPTEARSAGRTRGKRPQKNKK